MISFRNINEGSTRPLLPKIHLGIAGRRKLKGREATAGGDRYDRSTARRIDGKERAETVEDGRSNGWSIK